MRKYCLYILFALLFLAETAMAASGKPHTFAEHSVLADGMWVKVAVEDDQNRIYQISYSQLRDMGFAHPERVQVYGYGGHVLAENLDEVEYDDLPLAPMLHDAAQNRLLFAAHGLVKWNYDSKRGYYHRRNVYETKSFYFLHEADGTLHEADGAQSADSLSGNSTREEHPYLTLLHEEELVNIGQSGREKYGESFLSNRKQTFKFGELGAGDIHLRINAIAKASATTSYTVWVNGAEMGKISIPTTSSTYSFASEGWFEQTLHLDAESEVDVTLQYEAGSAKVDLARLNYIEAVGNWCEGLSGHRKITLEEAREAREIQFGNVTLVGKVANQDLHALPHCDMLIVTAPAYLSEANRLAEYRRSHDGLSVTVLTPEKIYNEFSSGGQDPTAIRLLVKKLQPQYLLLFGKGHYDNQKINRQYLLPSYETDYSLSETASCVCDDYFGFIEDGEGGKTDIYGRYQISDESLDVGIGRLPVTSEIEAKAVVDKIIAYSDNRYQGAWKSRLCFLSDDDKVGDSYNAHIRHNDQLVKSLEQSGHKDFVMQKIYLPAYKQTATASGTDYPDAKKEFMEALKQGVLLVNYAGHGNTSTITNENMMTSATASQLNMRYLPVWVTASCDVGRWDNDEASLGEILTLNANGGAIAALTTVRVVYAHQNLILNQAIIDNLFDRNADGTRFRLGDVLRAAKRSLGRDYNKLNFCLLGDPSLTMAYPEQQLAITEVNGQPADGATAFEFKALETVTMKGAIYKTGSKAEVDSTFNGIVFPTLYDALDTLVADKGFLQDKAEPYRFTTRTRKAFSGRGEVKNGQFEFSFMVPQDIAYSNKTGLATLYACSDAWAEAQGYFDQYMLTGESEVIRNDTVGPEITRLFLNDIISSQKDWIVNATPYFYAEVQDESGFNTTGNGIGHDMVLTIKCTSNPMLSVKQYILNNYFSTYTGRYNIGSVRFSIPAMEDGEYEASFTVWDVFNNATRRVFHFTVAAGKSPDTFVVQAYPSPAKVGEKLTFRVLHNRPESETQLKLEVFNALGHLVYETTSHINNTPLHYAQDMRHPTVANTSILADETAAFMGNSSIVWATPNLGPGFYVYRIVMTSDGSQKVSGSRVLMIEE